MKGLMRWCGAGARASCFTALLASTLWLGLPQNVPAAWVLTDRNSTVGLDASGMSAWTADGYGALGQQSFFWRQGGSGPEFNVSAIGAPTVTQANTRQLTALYANSMFGVQLSFLLSGGTAGSGRAGLNESFRIFNYTASPLEFHFFQYVDIPWASSVSIGTDGSLFNLVSQTGAAGISSTVTPSANGAEAALFNATLVRLTDGLPTTLNNNLTAGPGHVTWALQWDFNIDANSSVVISSLNNLQVPEPSLLAFGVLGLGAWLIRRRNAV